MSPDIARYPLRDKTCLGEDIWYRGKRMWEGPEVGERREDSPCVCRRGGWDGLGQIPKNLAWPGKGSCFYHSTVKNWRVGLYLCLKSRMILVIWKVNCAAAKSTLQVQQLRVCYVARWETAPGWLVWWLWGWRETDDWPYLLERELIWFADGLM